MALSFLPAAAVGFALERPIERYLGKPGTIAIGLIAGAAAMAGADRSAQERTFEEALPADGWWLGVAQSSALFPGVSRNGATLTAARLRKFTRVDAERLSWHVALPVIGGATALEVPASLAAGAARGAAGPFAIGAIASLASTLAHARLIERVKRDRSLLPFAVYRVGLGSRATQDPLRAPTESRA